MGGICSCQKEGGVDRGDINAAIKLTATQVTASSAVISAVTAQDNVAWCYYVAPVPVSEVQFVDMDAIDRKAYIVEHGKKVQLPLKDEIKQELAANTSYSVAILGYDEADVARTAPYYTTFKTGSCEASVSAAVSGEGPFEYKYNVTVGANASKVKYIVSTEDSVVEMDDAALKTYIESASDTKETKISLDDVLSSTKKVSFVVAALPYDDMNRAGKVASARIIVEKNKVIKVGTDLKASTANVYEGIVKLDAQGSFVFEFEGKQYGFIPYSGNGGVGTVENEFAAVPAYNLTAQHVYKFNVEKAIGQLAEITDDPAAAVSLWTNMTTPADVKVVFDNSYADGKPRYYLEIVNKDEKRVFYEGFDLFVYGGFYQAPVKGTGNPIESGGQVTLANVPNIDGTEPGLKGSIATTTNGVVPFTWNSPDNDPAKDGQATETFIKNRGLLGWSLKRTSEFPGFIQLGNSQSTHFDAYFITPKMSALTGATNVIMETETYRFAGNGDIKLAILGAGSFTSATTTVVAGTKAVAGTYAPGCANLSSTEFTITGDILPKEANADLNKSILKISIEVTGATADTQFKFYVPEETIASNGRIQFDYINVYKK